MYCQNLVDIQMGRSVGGACGHSTPDGWCMKRTNIYLAEGQAAALDRPAEAEVVPGPS